MTKSGYKPETQAREHWKKTMNFTMAAGHSIHHHLALKSLIIPHALKTSRLIFICSNVVYKKYSTLAETCGGDGANKWFLNAQIYQINNLEC